MGPGNSGGNTVSNTFLYLPFPESLAPAVLGDAEETVSVSLHYVSQPKIT